jgi:nucleotide-binding universal stress UspA family protein
MNAIPVQDHVAVGIDGSPASHAALRWAAREAEMRHVPLHIIHGVMSPGSAWQPLVTGRRLPRRWASSGLRDGADYMVAVAIEAARRLAPSVDVSGAAVRAATGPMLVSESARAALLVVGSRGAGGYAGMLLGSTSGYTATRAECPVVVVPPAWKPQSAGSIVVGVDGSEVANLAVRFAFEEADLRRVPLMAIRAFSPITGAGRDSEPEAIELRQLERMNLATSLARWVAAYPDVRFDGQAVPGNPVNALIDAAAEAQLLVVGSRGLSGIGGLLLGSVSLRVLHHGGCPIGVVHPHHHDAGHLRRRRIAAVVAG